MLKRRLYKFNINYLLKIGRFVMNVLNFDQLEKACVHRKKTVKVVCFVHRKKQSKLFVFELGGLS